VSAVLRRFDFKSSVQVSGTRPNGLANVALSLLMERAGTRAAAVRKSAGQAEIRELSSGWQFPHTAAITSLSGFCPQQAQNVQGPSDSSLLFPAVGWRV
jgi:hypothetical protein